MGHFRLLSSQHCKGILVDFHVEKAVLAQIMEILNDLLMVSSGPLHTLKALAL